MRCRSIYLTPRAAVKASRRRYLENFKARLLEDLDAAG